MSNSTQSEREACLHWLFNACRTWILHKFNPGPETSSNLTFQELNRDVLEKMAHYHNLEPLLHDLVKSQKLAEDEIPNKLKEKWEEAYFSTFVRNSEILTLISQLLFECKQKNIPLIILKGPSVIADVYEDIGLRPMADLDIFCRKQDLLVFRDIVYSLGCKKGGIPWLHHLDFFHEKFEILLELHFNLFQYVKNKSLFLEKAWEDKTELSIDDLSFPVLSLEHRIVFELAHFRLHNYKIALKHLLDFAARHFFLRNKINKEKLLSLLSQISLSEDFYLMSHSLKKLMDLSFPKYTELEQPKSEVDSFKNNLFDLSSSIGFSKYRKTGSEFRQQEGFQRKIVYIWKKLFPPFQVLQAAYNLSSPLKALFFIPVHLGKLCGDFRKNIKGGF